MRKRNGFIAIPLVLSVILFATVILFFMFSRFSNNNYYMGNIEKGVKNRLANSKSPYCKWGKIPFMKLKSGSAVSTMFISCHHVDGLKVNNNSTVNPKLSIKGYTEAGTQTNDLVISDYEIIEDGNGYRILLEMTGKKLGKFYLRLEKGLVCTKASTSICNIELPSSIIEVE